MTPADLPWGADGLLPAVVQGAADGEVLMVARMNAEALERTLSGPHAVFWSRSRGALWTKGETSGSDGCSRHLGDTPSGGALNRQITRGGPSIVRGAPHP